jgi:hypothetical protein
MSQSQEQSQDSAKDPERPSFESWWKRSKDVLKTRKITFVQAANQLGMFSMIYFFQFSRARLIQFDTPWHFPKGVVILVCTLKHPRGSIGSKRFVMDAEGG